MAWGLSDLIGLLDRWAVWKEMKANADKVPQLERRIAALEARLQRAPGEACPRCGAYEFRVIKSERDQVLGRLGGMRQHLECKECGFKDEKLVTPK